jgi:hypothetical protein
MSLVTQLYHEQKITHVQSVVTEKLSFSSLRQEELRKG